MLRFAALPDPVAGGPLSILKLLFSGPHAAAVHGVRGLQVSLALAIASAAACAEAPPPAFRVGSLAFDASVSNELPPGGEASLADVAAWGLVVRDSAADSLFAPLADRVAERSRLRTLPYLLGAEALGMTEDSLRAVYAASPEWELDVRHIVRLAEEGAPAAEREQARGVAQEVLRRARAGEDFASLAAQFSEEPGAAERGGLLQPGREGSWVGPFWEAAVALRPGELSEVVETEYGFHVLRLDERRPVPFAEADRAALLLRAVPESVARTAMERWAATAPAPAVDPAAVTAAREAILSGSRPLATAIVTTPAGQSYTGYDLALGWASTDAAEHDALLNDPGSLGVWLENDVREHAWTAAAARMGAPLLRGAAQDELYVWLGRGLGWSAVFGFSSAMSEEELRRAVLVGASSGRQDFVIARQELRGIRALLRLAYPFEAPSAVTASSSSSEMP